MFKLSWASLTNATMNKSAGTECAHSQLQTNKGWKGG